MAVLRRYHRYIYEVITLLVHILLTHDDAIWCNCDAIAHNISTWNTYWESFQSELWCRLDSCIFLVRLSKLDCAIGLRPHFPDLVPITLMPLQNLEVLIIAGVICKTRQQWFESGIPQNQSIMALTWNQNILPLCPNYIVCLPKKYTVLFRPYVHHRSQLKKKSAFKIHHKLKKKFLAFSETKIHKIHKQK